MFHPRILRLLRTTNRKCCTSSRKYSRRINTSTNNTPPPATPPKLTSFKTTFYRFARVGRYLSMGYILYQCGYYQGLKWYAKDPHKADLHLTKSFIRANAIDKNEDSIIEENDEDHIRVSAIAKNISQAAIRLSSNKIKELMEKKNHIKDTIELIRIKEEISKWQDNLWKLNGNWRVVLIKSDVPNAFVCELVPRKIFINSSIIHKLKATDDEIALLLGHELSHLLLDHGEDKHKLEEVLVVIAIVLMTFVDPTGWFAMVFDSFLLTAIGYIKAGFSRHEETEADHLGIQLASMSCYNPVKGAVLMKKFSQLSKSVTETSWDSTHPSSMSRYEDLTELGRKYELEHKNACTPVKSTWESLFKK